MVANAKQSYDLTIECKIEGTSTTSSNTLDLKNPYFRYTGVAPAPPPGNNHTSPSEDYWGQMDLAGARQAVNLVNGVIVDGLGHVSLDSTGPSLAHQQPNIHQGSIPATGRRDKNTSVSTSKPSLPTSSATSLPFNQLIGGAVSPGLVSVSGASSQPLNLGTSNSQPYPVIGDYAMLSNNFGQFSP
jgi:histone-arginine methyltransferase CARM1